MTGAWLFMEEIKKDLKAWDELWEKYIQRIGYESKENIEKWAKQVKVEGDKLRKRAYDYRMHVSILSHIGAMFSEHACYIPGNLRYVIEKAEKWDKYTLDGKNITPEIIEQNEELENKLEAIKIYLQTRPKSYSKRGSITKAIFNEWQSEVLEILGEVI